MKSNNLYFKRKYNFIEIIFLIFVIWSAGGATIYQSYLYSPNNLATIPIVAMCLCILYKRGISWFNSFVLKIIILLLIWGTLGTFYMGYNCQYFYLIYNIFLSYTLVKTFNRDIFIYYEKTVTFFSLMSLIAFFSVLMVPSLAEFLKMISVERHSGLWESNVLLFGIQKIDPEAAIIFSRRNLGFAWEPGRFSVIVVIAMFFNLLTHNLKLKNNYSFWILFLTLITTQSTTGYACFVIVLMFYLYNSKYKQMMVPMALIIFIIFSSISFMNEKIISVWNWQENQSVNFNNQISYYTENGMVYVPQRFEGIYYDYLNFINSPLWGYGVDWRNSYINTELFPNALIYASDGVVQIFASCGLFVAFLLYLLLYRSSKCMSEIFSYQGKYAYLILFVLINFSYNFWAITIFLSFILYPLFSNEKIQSKYYNSSVQRI